jgi:hypothetical protein
MQNVSGANLVPERCARLEREGAGHRIFPGWQEGDGWPDCAVFPSVLEASKRFRWQVLFGGAPTPGRRDDTTT